MIFRKSITYFITVREYETEPTSRTINRRMNNKRTQLIHRKFEAARARPQRPIVAHKLQFLRETVSISDTDLIRSDLITSQINTG